MGRKFNDVVKQVGKKLTLLEKYIPMLFIKYTLNVAKFSTADGKNVNK